MSLWHFLFYKKRFLEEKLYIPQRRAFFAWAKDNFVCGDIALITIADFEEYYMLKESGWKKIRIDHLSVPTPRLILCLPKKFGASLEFIEKKEQMTEWQNIFSSQVLEVWEWRKYYKQNKVSLPLRFGFSEEEKTVMMKYVRKSVESKLRRDESKNVEKNNPENRFSVRFSEPVSLGVALWIEGQLRSSVIVKNMSLNIALGQAAEKLPYDPRFKPVTYEEFLVARIEITVMQEPRFPLTQEEEGSERIDSLKGYQVSWEGTYLGWYLPEVFNCVRFLGMNDLLVRLAEDKSGVSRKYLPQAKKVTFEVTDFIESHDKKSILDLCGPKGKIKKNYSEYAGSFQSDLEICLHKAAQSLIRFQQDDGNIPPICNPLTGKMKQVDWTRQALSAGALILVGQTMGNLVYQEAGEKALRYMEESFFNHPMLALSTKSIASAYYAKALLLLGRNKEAIEMGIKIVKNIEHLKYTPIGHLQISSLLLSFGPEHAQLFQEGKTILEKALKDYSARLKRGEKIQLAFFPEAISCLLKLAKYEKKNDYQEKVLDMMYWLTHQELADGSFPIIPGSEFAYTRGTGKIFEVLALDPEKNKESLLRVFAWLRSMQYTEDNTYFALEEIQQKILGGFRHDALNQEVWTDASAHVLIGGARLLEWLKTGKTSFKY